MRTRIIVAALVAALAACTAALAQNPEGQPAPQETRDKTPASCDNRPAMFHVKRAKAIIRNALAHREWRDRTPAGPKQKRRWAKHRRCVLHDGLRQRIADYHQKRYRSWKAWRKRMERRWKKRQRARLYAKLISPPGKAWLDRLGACEADSSGGYRANTGNGYYGRYQFDLQTWGTTYGAYTASGYARYSPPVSPPSAAPPDQQDIRAAILYRSRGPSPWPVCGR